MRVILTADQAHGLVEDELRDARALLRRMAEGMAAALRELTEHNRDYHHRTTDIQLAEFSALEREAAAEAAK